MICLILTSVNGKTEEDLKKESSSIFVTNILLTTKIKKLQIDNDHLRKKLVQLEVGLKGERDVISKFKFK